MKLRHILIPTLIGATLYKVFQNRHQLEAHVKDSKTSVALAKQDIDNIKSNLSIISKEKDKIVDMADDLTYKIRVFQQESQPSLEAIQERMANYQKRDEA